jgi:hypothetical protein
LSSASSRRLGVLDELVLGPRSRRARNVNLRRQPLDHLVDSLVVSDVICARHHLLSVRRAWSGVQVSFLRVVLVKVGRLSKNRPFSTRMTWRELIFNLYGKAADQVTEPPKAHNRAWSR